jgi:glycosyltransferase involved in cell wall biosynthesis
MTTDAVGGVWTYCVELCRELDRRGIEVLLASMGAPPSREQEIEVSQLAGVELRHGSFPLEWMSASGEEIAAAGEWLGRLERELAPDIVHLNQYCHGARAWNAPVVMAAHSCVLTWWRSVKGASAPEEWRPYFDRVRTGLHAADVVVAPTRALVAEMDEIYGQLDFVRVIPNGRSAALFPRRRKEEFVFSAGRLWDEGKNLRTLARAAERVTWPVVVAGEIRHPDDGHEESSSGVHLLGRLEHAEVASWMGRAAVYALPARYEPFGLSVLEAALSGCALVLGDLPSLRELWDGAALFVPSDDERLLADALQALAADRAERDRLATRARARALRLDPVRMATGYLSVYRMASSPQRKPLRLQPRQWSHYAALPAVPGSG